MATYNKNFIIKSNNVSTVDYKLPVPPRSDMRTSYYFGHRQIYDIDVYAQRKNVRPVVVVPKKQPFEPAMKSEMKDSYTQKFAQAEAKYTRSRIDKVKGIKGFDEGTFKFIPRPIKQDITTYRTEYTEKRPEPNSLPLLSGIEAGSKIKPATFTVSAEKPTYSKYLDLMASSHSLDYIPFSNEQLSTLAANDYLTLWKWSDTVKSNVVKEVHPAYISTSTVGKEIVPSRTAVKNRNVPKLLCPVPTIGLVSEFGSNYVRPDDSIKFEVNLQESVNMVEPLRVTLPKTEFSMIGSGDRIQRFV